MKILVSNDDGVYADGLTILNNAMRTLGETCVVAPDRNRSGASNSLTLSRPVSVKQIPNGFWSVEGTPTDCVHLALTGLLDYQPDIVVSGINAGANLGDDILYSGTVAAATEGRFLGLPAIAISLVGDTFKHFDTAAEVAKILVKHLSHDPLSLRTILNVNVPDLPLKEIRGFEVTRFGTRHAAEPTIKTKDPRGNTIYWVGPAGAEADAGPGTDFHAIAMKKVSITPMHLDLTHYESFEKLGGWVMGLETVNK